MILSCCLRSDISILHSRYAMMGIWLWQLVAKSAEGSWHETASKFAKFAPGFLKLKLKHKHLGFPQPIYSNQPRRKRPHHKGVAWGTTHPSRSRTRNLPMLDPAF